MPTRSCASALLILVLLTACISAPPAPTPTPTPNSNSNDINLDPATQALIASADRVAFIIPFSHWDTDWHEDFAAYSKRSDGNILAAIQLAQGDSRFRYTFEQVLFVQHFWENYPDQREDLKYFVQSRQFTFAWGGITQPETSLVSPTIQVRNLQLGQQWIADTFGAEYIPHTAWQSDAFGNSAAFPIFLASNDIPYLFIGRWQHKCDPDYDDCQPLPHLFYWSPPSPRPGRGDGGEGSNPDKVLVAYLSYPNAWDAIHRVADEEEQTKALRAYIEEQFARTESKYVFIPMGSDFIDPLPNIISLVNRWNTSGHETAFVIADPETAFHYIATQDLPTISVDLNPIWQAFYGTRPFAKIADKEAEYYLTAADKFGILLGAPQSSAWQTAAINAHYDNIGAVSFDSVWESSQRPRFEGMLTTAADDLSTILAAIANGIDSPLVIFNPAAWERSEVIEIGIRSDDRRIPLGQSTAQYVRAIQVDAVPGIGWAVPSTTTQPPDYPVTVTQSGNLTTLTNGLVSITLDSSHGGTISNLRSLISNSPNLISTYSDDVTFWRDDGDVYGARFGDVLARESDANAQVDILAKGPLLARARVMFTLSGQTITKTVTLRADSPLVEIELTLAALPNTSVVLHTHTNLNATTRTDDLGFAPFTHEHDNTPITPGDITYRRDIFYPIIYWSDVSDDNGSGLALITHGLQGLGGTSDLNLLLVRDAREDREGVTDVEAHTFRYAYLPHMGQVSNLPQLAYAFNQPLIPVLKSGAQITVQIPFTTPRQFPLSPSTHSFPSQHALLSSESALVTDLYRDGNETRAVVIDYDPGSLAALKVGDQTISIPAAPLSIIPIKPKWELIWRPQEFRNTSWIGCQKCRHCPGKR